MRRNGRCAPAWLGLVAAVAVAGLGGCKGQPNPIIINIDNTADTGPGVDFAPVYVMQEGETLDLVVTPSDPNATLMAAPLPANSTFADSVFSFNPDFGQSGVYSIDFTADFDAMLSIETIGIRVHNVIHIATPPTTSVDEGGSVMLGFASDDPPGTVVNYTASIGGVPIPGATFDPFAAELTFEPPFNHLDAYPNPTIITVSAAGTELDTGVARVSTADVAFDVVEKTSFALEVQAIFSGNCAFTGGCHAGASPAAGMNLEPGNAYGNLVMVAPAGPDCGSGIAPEDFRVSPGDVGESLLYAKVSGMQSCGARMPFECDVGGAIPCLSEAQIRKIEIWIADGALMN
jgi:hypothetical protein